MKIFVSSHPIEAYIVCQYLQQFNIHCEVKGENLYGLSGELPFTEETLPYVWLLDETQIADAQVRLMAYQSEEISEKTYWICKQCSEENEPQFAACWYCGCLDSN
ncbi:hypothetical protein CCZ37_07550 [Vibrio qinghaiensis]|uniref:RanBP2-type domain-containing protein n=1 Tax=Vibrio qinghaiensis TaxID=2025808 RepID=A0A223MY18_9VIBR|nr:MULTISPECIES: DUF2007 domain-containing protein [Vibrio]ASU22455.1 hypothetical protein CCZ37_07550 [Vibrio qinghaiensis]